MDAVVQQLPALLGVVIGAIATFLTTSLGDRARWQRERRSRWDESRMRAYTEYSNAVKAAHLLALRIACGRGYPHTVDPVAPDEAVLQALGVAEAERARVWEGVLLLGDPQTVAAARSWHESVWQVEAYAQGRLSAPEAWESAVTQAERARDRYYDCARRDLGVAGGLSPTPPWRSRPLAHQGPGTRPESD